jgi:hypothetical protein
VEAAVIAALNGIEVRAVVVRRFLNLTPPKREYAMLTTRPSDLRAPAAQDPATDTL